MHRGAPVLFIPGNAGSSRQVRSIASSAARQYFTEPFTPNAELVARGVKPLDFFAGIRIFDIYYLSAHVPSSRI